MDTAASTSRLGAENDDHSVGGRAGDEPADGRTALRLRNRQKVLDALVLLIEEGETSPSLAQVIERSGVSERSIFRYFDDLGDLSMEAIRHAVRQVEPLGVIDDIGQGDLEHRIKQLVAARLRVAQRVRPFGALARERRSQVPEIAAGLELVLVALRKQVEAQFAAELSVLAPAGQRDAVDLILTVLSFEGHDVLAHQLERGDRVVARIWSAAIRSALHVERA